MNMRIGRTEKNDGGTRSRLTASRRLHISIAVSMAFVLVEAVLGISSRSLALISDAGHNFVDVIAMSLTLFAVYMSARPPTEQRTYGYGRVGILTALINALGLVAVAGILIYEAVKRLIDVQELSGATVIMVAVGALVVNTAVALLLVSERRDLNIRSAFLHVVTDAGISLGVVAAGVIIWTTEWYYADPIISLVISGFILYGAWGIMREAVNILLESVPPGIRLEDVVSAIEAIPGVDNAHHVHVWEIGSGFYALSGHVVVQDRHLSDCAGILKKIDRVLKENFNIAHPTIQLECTVCTPEGTCVITPASEDDPNG